MSENLILPLELHGKCIDSTDSTAEFLINFNQPVVVVLALLMKIVLHFLNLILVFFLHIVKRSYELLEDID